MAINLGPLSTLPTTVEALQNLVLVSPQSVVGYQPQNAPIAPGITPQPNQDAFIFNYEGEQSVTLESDISDHYIENNSAINDQVSLKPEIINTRGYIGELTDIIPTVLQPLQTSAQKLTIISGYAPSLSVTALVALNTATQAYATGDALLNTNVGKWGSISNGFSGTKQQQNKQQQAFTKLYLYWQKRTLFTIQTPWQIFNNCAIKTLRAVQDAETLLVTDFEISFKVLRFSQTVIAGGVQKGQARFNNSVAANSTNVEQLAASSPATSDPSATVFNFDALLGKQ